MMGLNPYHILPHIAWDVLRSLSGEMNAPVIHLFQRLNICINLLRDPKYSPSLPWVSKLTKQVKLAADLCTCVDTIRSIAFSEEEVWVVRRRMVTYCIYLGIQDTTQKRHIPSKTPETWAGTMITYQYNQLLYCVDKVKWG